MSALTLRLKKGRDGPPVLTCVRDDGSSTWERLHPAIAVHDLVHYAVESELGMSAGFYGLVASGWSFETFHDREARRALPLEALTAELVVGLFWQELNAHALLAPAELNAMLAAMTARYTEVAAPVLEGEQIERVRAAVREWVDRWHLLPPGETLELRFPAPAAAR